MKKVNIYTIIPFLEKRGEEGGGNQTCQIIHDNIIECGCDIQVITPKSKEWADPNKSDLNILLDAWNDPYGSDWFHSSRYDEIRISKIPYIISECAYTGVSKEPYGWNKDHLPWSNTDYFLNAAKVVLASPLHRDHIIYLLNLHTSQEISNIYLYLREVDTTKFYNTNQPRDIEYLTVGASNWYKGTDIVKEKYGDELTVVDLGTIPHNQMPEIYNKAKHFVHLPRWCESFSRTTAEAALCGCNIITNDNVGAISWNKDLSDPNIYKESKENFKEMIRSLI